MAWKWPRTWRGCARREPATLIRWRAITPGRLAQWLPGLGNVLYLPARGVLTEGYAGHPLLLEQAELVPLAYARWLGAAGMVTPDGPREWLDVFDFGGRALARLHLLPDSDYCAWDALLEGADVPGPDRPATVLHARSVHWARFAHRCLGGMDVLGVRSPDGLSYLGRRVAMEVARQESVCGPEALLPS